MTEIIKIETYAGYDAFVKQLVQCIERGKEYTRSLKVHESYVLGDDIPIEWLSIDMAIVVATKAYDKLQPGGEAEIQVICLERPDLTGSFIISSE